MKRSRTRGGERVGRAGEQNGQYIVPGRVREWETKQERGNKETIKQKEEEEKNRESSGTKRRG